MATSEVRKIVRDRTWLEKARRVSGKTQKEVADAAGCSETYYNRIEKGLQIRLSTANTGKRSSPNSTPRFRKMLPRIL